MKHHVPPVNRPTCNDSGIHPVINKKNKNSRSDKVDFLFLFFFFFSFSHKHLALQLTAVTRKITCGVWPTFLRDRDDGRTPYP